MTTLKDIIESANANGLLYYQPVVECVFTLGLTWRVGNKSLYLYIKDNDIIVIHDSLKSGLDMNNLSITELKIFWDWLKK